MGGKRTNLLKIAAARTPCCFAGSTRRAAIALCVFGIALVVVFGQHNKLFGASHTLKRGKKSHMGDF